MTSSSPHVGAVYRVSDALTGWSQEPRKLRWATVVAVNDPVLARLLPRSASIEDGVHVGVDALDPFEKDGFFVFDPKAIALADLREMECVGTLAAPHLTHVLRFYRDRLAKRKEGRRRPSSRSA